MGPSDLDMRPPEMARSTMDFWVDCCDTCGYCAADPSDESVNASWFIKTPEYTKTLEEESYPELANIFRCKSLINEVDGKYAEAAKAALHAAWVCDDHQLIEQSYTCRINAIRLLKEAESNHDEYSAEEGISRLVLIDMLRRVEKYEEATSEINKLQSVIDDPGLLRILIYQATLIGKKDRACHTVPSFEEV